MWTLLALVPDDPALRLGVLLVLLVPCTDWFVAFTHLGGGDVKRALTPLSLLLQILLLPVYLALFFGGAVRGPSDIYPTRLKMSGRPAVIRAVGGSTFPGAVELVRFGGQYWDVVLPPGWEGSHDPECDLIFDPLGCGALQVSAALKSGQVTEEDLLDLASDDLRTGISPQPVSAGDFEGFTFAYRQGDEHWQRWFLRHGSVALFMTYNCRLEDHGTEDASLDAMLRSLRVRLSAA